MPETPLTNVIAFALEKLPAEPVARRVALYRDIAKICGSEDAARTLNGIAADLVEIERKYAQLRLDLGEDDAATGKN